MAEEAAEEGAVAQANAMDQLDSHSEHSVDAVPSPSHAAPAIPLHSAWHIQLKHLQPSAYGK